MDYSKLSDFEINCEVLAKFEPDINHMCLSESKEFFYDCGPSGDGWHQIDIPNYCNNPADAWPIIVDKKIGLKPVRWDEWRAEGDDSSGFVSCASCNKNPLRAAMIVFLMMQESANVPANSTGSDIR